MFLLKLSFFKLGIVLKALISASGLTKVELELKLFADKLSSYKEAIKDMSVGKVCKLLAPKLSTVKFGNFANSIICPGGILL